MLVGDAVVRSVHNIVTTGKVNFADVAKEVLYDRYGGRPTPAASNTNSTVGSSQTSGTGNVSTNTKHPFEPQKTGGTGSVADTKSTLRPNTTPSAAPNTNSRDPRAGCGGNGNSYGYNYGTSNTVKTRPSTVESLRERWANPNTLINDVSTVAMLAGAGGLGKAAVAIVKNVKKTVTKGASIFKNLMKDNRGEINVPKGVIGAKIYSQYAIKATKNPKGKSVVLGKYNQDGISYVEVAKSKNATYFELNNWDDVVEKVGEENMWNINKEFLNQQWKAGKDFYLSHNPWKATGYFKKEISHLKKLGAKDFVKTGDIWKMVK